MLPQYYQAVRRERDELRLECDAALKQRFWLEQCIRQALFATASWL
jgi:hypothetical protein